MSRLTRSVTVASGLVVASAVIAISAGAVGAKGSSGKATSGVVYAAITHTAGKIEFAAGNTSDRVLGTGAVTFELSVGTGSKPGVVPLKGTVVVFGKTGELSGSDSVDLNVGTSGVTFTNGKLDLTKGTGGEKGHSFVGTFTGSAKSVSGPYVFQEKGTYK